VAYASAGWTTGGQPIGFSAALADLGGSNCSATPPTATNTCLIDPVLAGATASGVPKSGYYFVYAPGTGTNHTTFDLNGAPAAPQQTGNRYFYADASGVIRFNPSQAATSADTALQ